MYSLPGPNNVALASPTALVNNGANCGRCVELVYTAGSNTTRVTVTVVGLCDAAQCPNQNFPSFALNAVAFQTLTQNIQLQLPVSGTTLKYSFVPCPVVANEPILANFNFNAGAPDSVVFLQHRYGIASATVEDPTVGQQFAMQRNSLGYWVPSPGGTLNLPGGVTVRLTDVNNKTLAFTNFSASTQVYFSTNQQFPACPLP
jgi:hypothetical protein